MLLATSGSSMMTEPRKSMGLSVLKEKRDDSLNMVRISTKQQESKVRQNLFAPVLGNSLMQQSTSLGPQKRTGTRESSTARSKFTKVQTSIAGSVIGKGIPNKEMQRVHSATNSEKKSKVVQSFRNREERRRDSEQKRKVVVEQRVMRNSYEAIDSNKSPKKLNKTAQYDY